MDTPTITLLIKNPSPSFVDFTLQVPISSNISHLKEILRERYPSNPLPQTQKLIFAGKLLKDDVSLRELLSQCDKNVTQTFHLVLSNSNSNTVQSRSPSNESPQSRNSSNSIRFQFIPLNQQQQFPWNQYPGNVQVQGNNDNMGPQPLLAPERPVPVAMGVRVGVGVGAQRPGPAVDSVWLLIKLAFLFYVFTQGGTASTLRLVLLGFGACLVFLYQTGHITFTPPPLHPNPLPNPNHVQANNGPNVNINERDQQPINGNDEERETPVAPALPGNQNGIVGEVSRFVLPFFYSLFPTWNPNAQHA